ncbi:MAG: aminodeoxychorismate/anthranilate synthase component II [Myxococcales bacterium]|nr:aminodeoxychorismate/anthranilate synthase component II [Myxococcales bacterium]
MVLVIDNYDSFTYNLVQYLLELGQVVRVVRNDELTVEELGALAPTSVLISPGPGTPEKAGISLEAIKYFEKRVPVFGVCLGHQALAHQFGAKVIRAERLMHGRTSSIRHDGRGVFSGVPSPFTATRYHSLIVERSSIPPDLEVTAWTEDDEVMGIRHRERPLHGVQFHPESFLSEHGHKILGNFLALHAGAP